MTRFYSQKRFDGPDKDADLPYKNKLQDCEKSDFGDPDPRGVRFGKEREPVNFLGSLQYSASNA